jgi:hypothetical protein
MTSLMRRRGDWAENAELERMDDAEKVLDEETADDAGEEIVDNVFCSPYRAELDSL